MLRRGMLQRRLPDDVLNNAILFLSIDAVERLVLSGLVVLGGDDDAFHLLLSRALQRPFVTTWSPDGTERGISRNSREDHCRTHADVRRLTARQIYRSMFSHYVPCNVLLRDIEATDLVIGLRDQIDYLQGELDAARNATQSDIEDLEDRNAELERQLEISQQNCEELEGELAQVAEEALELRDNLDELESRLQ